MTFNYKQTNNNPVNYRNNKDFADACMPAAMQIVAKVFQEKVNPLIRLASFEQDTKEATDFIVMNVQGKKLACRVRRPDYANRTNNFTLRCWLSRSDYTEFQKILDGWADWMFYGVAKDTKTFIGWIVIDLHAWRAQIREYGLFSLIDADNDLKKNADGTSEFYVFHTQNFYPEPQVIIAKGGNA